MTTLERLEIWKQSEIISDAQHGLLSRLVTKRRFSLFLELNALLYLGVLSLAGGLAWTFSTHFEKLGDVFILSVLSVLLAASSYYCFRKVGAYSNEEVESANFILDYLLYLACLTLSVELGYIEFRFQWLRDAWDNYLLFSSVVFFVLAYRFDNRFVLSLGLSALAGWFGLRVSRFGYVSSEPLRLSALLYAFVVALIGTFMYRQRIKKHFLETYLHIAALVAFVALVSGLEGDFEFFYLSAALLLSAASIVLGFRFKRFAFVVYGIVFGYFAITFEVSRVLSNDSAELLYVVTTGSGVILMVVLLARRFGRVE